MASNSFGTLFRVTTAGESHGPCYIAIVDGVPSGLELNQEIIEKELAKRRAKGPLDTARQEEDKCLILSGLYEGKTTGTPIALQIYNKGANRDEYEEIKEKFRPSHANFAYLEKYGIFDPYGGGRASGRETVCRVAAGAIAKALLKQEKIELLAYVSKIGNLEMEGEDWPFTALREQLDNSTIGCPDPLIEEKMRQRIEQVKEEGDSIGGAITFVVDNVPKGLGDPIYEKLTAKLGQFFLSIPSCKGVTFGTGVKGAEKVGSLHNDPFYLDEKGAIRTRKNDHGGILAGITTGERIYGKVYFKAPSSIKKPIETVGGHFQIPKEGRHDPTTVVRARSVVEAMIAIALIDAMMMQKARRWN